MRDHIEIEVRQVTEHGKREVLFRDQAEVEEGVTRDRVALELVAMASMRFAKADRACAQHAGD